MPGRDGVEGGIVDLLDGQVGRGPIALLQILEDTETEEVMQQRP